MGFKSKAPKAAVYVAPDLKDGDWSVSELQARNAAQQVKANEVCRATWPSENTLTKSEVKSMYKPGKASPSDYNAINQLNSLASKASPRGYKSGESTTAATAYDQGESK